VTEPAVTPARLAADSPGMLAWRTFLTAHATLIRALEAELEAEQDLALSDFDVLAQLHAAGGTLRMRDLADRVLLSRSGLTRRVDRLEGAGYVERAACETTAAGRTPASPTTAATASSGRCRSTSGHRRPLHRPLDADELAAIGATLAKVVPPDRRPG
jgi:DNA-binding MarR family transcriptional regulator